MNFVGIARIIKGRPIIGKCLLYDDFEDGQNKAVALVQTLNPNATEEEIREILEDENSVFTDQDDQWSVSFYQISP